MSLLIFNKLFLSSSIFPVHFRSLQPIQESLLLANYTMHFKAELIMSTHVMFIVLLSM